MAKHTKSVARMAIGIDLGDRKSQICVVDDAGDTVEEASLSTTQAAFERRFRCAPARIAIEAGAHSPWVSRSLAKLGHEVITANPRKLRAIYENDSKDDRADAQYLARIARLDPKLLYPIRHRSEVAQADREVLRARDALVRTRTTLVNHARGAVKAFGARLPKCGTDVFARTVAGHVPAELRTAIGPLLEMIEKLTRQIQRYDKLAARVAKERYPETKLLEQVPGVGSVTALAFVVTIEDPSRFAKSRSVGSFFGLRPKKSESGEQDPELRITKAGDSFVRRLLVQAAQHILGPFGEDTDLRRWGLKLAGRGKRNAKKRAVVAVARKLSVVLHRLWITGEDYRPLREELVTESRRDC